MNGLSLFHKGWRSLALLVGCLCLPSLAAASNAMLEEELHTIDNVQILKEKDIKPARFYYLPVEARVHQNKKKEPSFHIVKFNLPTTEVVRVSDKDGSPKMANQGGILLVEVRFDLEEARRQKIEKELQKKYPGSTLAMLPLEKGALQISMIDVQNKKLATFTSDAAPLNGSSVAFMMALDQDGVDVAIKTIEKGFAAVSFRFTFEYSGYLSPLKATISGKWERVYNHESWRSNSSGGVWFFKAAVDIQKVYDSLVATGAVKTTWTGAKDQNIEKLMDRVMEFILKEMFESSDLAKVAEKFQAPVDSTVPKTRPWWSWGFGVGTNFSYRKTEVRRKGDFLASFERWEKVPRKDLRDGLLKLTDLPEGWKQKAIINVERGNWTLVKPAFAVAGSENYEKVTVHVRYRPSFLSGKYEEKSIAFSKDSGLLSGVVAWNVNTSLPAEEQGQYEYRVDAVENTPGSRAQRYQTGWKKETKPIVTLTPADWNGSIPFTLSISYGGDLSQKNLTGLFFLLEERDALCAKKGLRMTSDNPNVEFVCRVRFNGKKLLKPKIKMYVYPKSGKSKSGYLTLEKGVEETSGVYRGDIVLEDKHFD